MEEDDSKAESTLEENIVKPNCTFLESIGENNKNVNRTTRKTVISVQGSDISSLEELDQKVKESFSKNSDGLYACHHCVKSFNRISNIKEHVEVHFEGLSFPCSFCDATLRSRNSVRFHKRQHYS